MNGYYRDDDFKPAAVETEVEVEDDLEDSPGEE